MHRIGGDGVLDELAPASKTTPEPQTVERLFELGRQAANRWLKKHLASVGEKGTVNIRRDYGDPLRLDFGTPESDGEDGADDAEGAAPG